jgi:hypothetical protein
MSTAVLRPLLIAAPLLLTACKLSGGDDKSFDTDDPDAVIFEPCEPPGAEFTYTGDFGAAGLVVDFTAEDCEAVSGFPPGDLLVVDDFGDGTYGGSGSGYEVTAIEGGSYVNEADYYQLSGLVAGEPIRVRLTDGTKTIEIQFTIDATSDPRGITAVGLRFL